MIVTDGLTKHYGRTLAVDDLSFTVTPGGVTGFLGPNGSGKSTTMRMILGLDVPDGGRALVNGLLYHELRWPLREVGALLDAKAFHPGRSARNHLRCLARTNDISAGLRDAMGAEWQKLVTLRSTKWALLIALTGTVLVSFLSTNGVRHQSANFYKNFDPTNTSLAGFALASLVIGILAVLSMTGEYGSGTIRSSLAATPRRSVFFGAKALVLGIFTLILGMVLSFLSFFVGQAVLSGGAPTATLGDPGVLRALVESGGFLALLALFGLGIGAIIRHSAGSIAVFVGCTLLVPLILHNVAGNPSRFMPVMLLGNSVGAVVPVFGALSSTAAFLLMALYAAIALAVGAAFLNRRDV
jgi:energy-coupling factor transporter ATP-binding protein EcfA2